METDISLSDEDAARAVQNGDAEVFSVLIARYETKLRRYARKFLVNKDDIDDTLQDIFIKAYEHIQSYDPHRPFSPWVYRIAHNELINTLDPKYRAPLVLYFYEDMDYKTIADVLRIPVSTVGVRINRAKKQLSDHYHTRYDHAR